MQFKTYSVFISRIVGRKINEIGKDSIALELFPEQKGILILVTQPFLCKMPLLAHLKFQFPSIYYL